MGDIFNQVEQQISEIRHWFMWVAVALAILVVINAVMASFVVWGMLRIAKLSEMNRFPHNPAQPSQALLYGAIPPQTGTRP